MSETNQPTPTPDDLLADFTDRVLDGKAARPASPAESELRGLEDAVLRLNELPREAPDERTLRRMQANFKSRVQKADSPTLPTWQLLRPRPRFAFAFAMVALLAVLVVASFLPLTGGSLVGTAGQQAQDLLLLVGLACVILLLLWARRRK